MLKNALMIQGTTSNAGKSILTAGLCRLLKNRAVNVAPFKPQNMALNSFVTIGGGEIGRAQVLQAFACGKEPHTDMNPVLLKPTTDTGSQIILNGQVIAQMGARQYHQFKSKLLNPVCEAFARLAAQHQFIMIEGAGSPAEINLRENDIANMGFAEAIDCPVLLVADIERGGVFAHLYGTFALLSQSEQERIRGFIINRFRGDVSLLKSGIDWLHEKTGKPTLGVVPFLHNLRLDAEDSLSRNSSTKSTVEGSKKFRISVLVTPKMSNDSDIEPLLANPDIAVEFVGDGKPVGACDLIILCGSKSVRSDLAYIRSQGWIDEIHRHLRYGGKLIGICGGFQMLGKTIGDPSGVESVAGCSDGLGFLDLHTEIKSSKILKRVSGKLCLEDALIEGYEIHMGQSQGSALENPAVVTEYGRDGAMSNDNQIMGTYIHGIFDRKETLQAVLRWCGFNKHQAFDFQLFRESQIERLADCLSDNLELNLIFPDQGALASATCSSNF